MTDPRKGLQRRYDLEEILELHQGQKKVKGLSYNALKMLRSPMYVKFAEEMKDASQDQNHKIWTHHNETNNVRHLSSKHDLPHDLLTEMRDFGDDEDDDDGGGGGGLSQGPFGESSSQGVAPPQRSRKTRREEKQQQMTGGYRTTERSDFPPEPPTAAESVVVTGQRTQDDLAEIREHLKKMQMPNVYNIQHQYDIHQHPPTGPAPSVAEVRNQLLVEAELDHLRQKFQKEEMSEAIKNEITHHHHYNPIREILKSLEKQFNSRSSYSHRLFKSTIHDLT